MTAHVVYPDLDPERPATTRRVIAGDPGRARRPRAAAQRRPGDGRPSGDPAGRAVAALEAGCDLALYCSGRLEETRAVLQAAPPLAPSLVARLEGDLASLAARPVEPFDPDRARGAAGRPPGRAGGVNDFAALGQTFRCGCSRSSSRSPRTRRRTAGWPTVSATTRRAASVGSASTRSATSTRSARWHSPASCWR